MSTVADRYAKSLLEVSIEQNKLEAIYNDIKGFKETLENKDLIQLINSPIINAEKKNSAFNALFNGKVDALTMTFFKTVINKSRENALPEICNAFIDQYRAKNNIASAKVITATKLSEEKLSSIKNSLNQNSGAATFEIEEEVDESLIGGFIIEMGDKRYDASVKHKLNKLRNSFS